MSNGRGVLYIVWGRGLAANQALDRSIASVGIHHPELPVHVVRLADEVDPVEGLLQKARMAELTPFETTLFLDADTVVLGDLDFGFKLGQRQGLACTICECPWARRYAGLQGDLIEYNTGVMFFTAKARPVFDAWQCFSQTIDSSVRFIHEGQLRTMSHNDQAAFAKAIAETAFQPAVLPINWNLRRKRHRSFFGPVRIWHDYAEVLPALVELNRYYQSDGAIIQYHEFEKASTGETQESKGDIQTKDV